MSENELVPVEQLSPCPFCGGENVKVFGPYGWYRQFGISHSCHSFYSGAQELAQGFHSKADAVRAWNTRTSSTPTAEPDEGLVEKVAKAINDVQGGLNYDYADFCRDAARAALSAATSSIRAKALEDAYEKLRGTNADLYRTGGEAYRAMLAAIRSLAGEQSS
ncbi:Lar family restriction alleviation protein [Sphingobium lignivorans]|uniref:Restriction alleviation protein Lar n=1 Tax=Sphingobium lignivorans TaxID=2735886 RepID=A0ABR6NH60_9SPHN|nr:Lar family restriction alleviation protein [Sphingobium lignivorans]MBB5985972.1 hypothetical protein [Sphingobium lignivorans]